MIVVGAARIASAGPSGHRIFALAWPFALARRFTSAQLFALARRFASARLAAAALAGFAGTATACGGNDVPIGGARGGAISALVGPNGGNLSNPPGGDDAMASDDAMAASDATTSSAGDGAAGSGGPTWTYLFNTYFYMTCQTTCHPQMSAPRNGYIWLKSQGYISGTSSAIAGPQSCLVWYGGDMPPGGTTNAQGVADLNAWVAAGAVQD